MQQREPPVRKPSLFFGSLFGCVTGLVVGTVIAFVLAANNGQYSRAAALQLLVCVGGLGTLIGFEIAVRRRKPHGGGTFSDEWRQFFGSPAFMVLAGLLLAVSFGVAVVSGYLFDALIR